MRKIEDDFLNKSVTMSLEKATEMFNYYDTKAKAMQMVLDGKSLDEVADFMGRSKASAAAWLSNGIYIAKTDEPQAEKCFKYLPVFPESLYCAIFGEKAYDVPVTWEKDLEYIFKNLPVRENLYIHLYFKECMTYEDIGKQDGLTKQRVRQIVMKGLNRLRHPYSRNILIYGLIDGLKEFATIEEEKELTILKLTGQSSEYLKEIIKKGKDPLSIDIVDLGLGVRARNCLLRSGIRTVGELKKIEQYQLLKMRNLGEKSLNEIMTKLRELSEIKEEIAC